MKKITIQDLLFIYSNKLDTKNTAEFTTIFKFNNIKVLPMRIL